MHTHNSNELINRSRLLRSDVRESIERIRKAVEDSVAVRMEVQRDREARRLRVDTPFLSHNFYNLAKTRK